jgi:hypothetical protein
VNCTLKAPRAPVNRLSRSPFGGTTPWTRRASAARQIPSFGGLHNGGDLGFGRDGYLYVSVGDGGCDYADDSGCQDENDPRATGTCCFGKILRLTPSGGIPTGNPFRGPRTARCARTGRTVPGKTCREAYAVGLRNPFRFAFDPYAAHTSFLIKNVGGSVWEEINRSRIGADYGWPARGTVPSRDGHAVRAPGRPRGPDLLLPPRGRLRGYHRRGLRPARHLAQALSRALLFADYVLRQDLAAGAEGLRLRHRGVRGRSRPGHRHGLRPSWFGSGPLLHPLARRQFEVRRIAYTGEPEGRFGRCRAGARAVGCPARLLHPALPA